MHWYQPVTKKHTSVESFLAVRKYTIKISAVKEICWALHRVALKTFRAEAMKAAKAGSIYIKQNLWTFIGEEKSQKKPQKHISGKTSAEFEFKLKILKYLVVLSLNFVWSPAI